MFGLVATNFLPSFGPSFGQDSTQISMCLEHCRRFPDYGLTSYKNIASVSYDTGFSWLRNFNKDLLLIVIGLKHCPAQTSRDVK